MKEGSSKYKGNCGLTTAISYFTTTGHTVSLPLNDSQNYDFVVDIDGSLKKVQVKMTTQKSRGNNTLVDLRNTGGTKGKVYSRIIEHDIDYLFVVNEEFDMWMIPKEEIKNTTSLVLGKDKYLVGKFNLEKIS